MGYQTTLTSGYLPAFGTQVVDFKVGVGAVSARLGTLIGGTGIPIHVDRLHDTGSLGGIKTRPYKHVIFQVPSTSANTVWMTFSNNTAPVVGGPGMELQKGVIYKFENAGDALLRPNTVGDYLVDAQSAFQLIAAGDTFINVSFID